MPVPSSYFPRWTLRDKGVVGPDERLPAGQTIAIGVQHVVAMFGATVRRLRPDHGDRRADLGREQRGLRARAQSRHRRGDADDRRRHLALRIGGFTLGGIGTATFGAIILYQLWRDAPKTT